MRSLLGGGAEDEEEADEEDILQDESEPDVDPLTEFGVSQGAHFRLAKLGF